MRKPKGLGPNGIKAGRSRRMILAQAAGLALTPMLALGVPVGAARAAARISAPAGPLRLRRVLERELADGKVLIVTREWMCDFAPHANGLLVEGDQTSVDVQAPKLLAPLAAIEKRREVGGLFPARLDHSGLIVTAGREDDGSAILHANETAAAILGTAPTSVFAGEDPRAFMARLAGTAAQLVSRIPRDLFYPHEGETKDTRAFPLGDGKSGEIEIRVSANARESDGLLQFSERLVTTRFEGEERVSRERWSLEGLG